MARIYPIDPNKLLRKLFLVEKIIYQHARSYFDSAYLRRRKILFITGCQRSGTSVMQRVFEKDLNATIYGERSKLSSVEGIRLNPLDMVKNEIQKDKAQFIVLKPLVESQNVLKLLDYFEGSKSLWLFRDYKDVAASNLKKFGTGNGIKDLRPIVEAQPNNWRSEGVSEETRRIMQQHFSETMNPYDAAVLVWYTRNRIFFDLSLGENPNVFMCKYEHLVAEPGEVFSNIYQELGQDFPGDQITQVIHSSSLRKGKDIELSPAIDELAKDLLERLNESYLTRRTASQITLIPLRVGG